MKTMDLDKLATELADEKSDRKSHSIYLSKSLFEDFRTLCEQRDISPSRAIELFLENAINETKSKKNSR